MVPSWEDLSKLSEFLRVIGRDHVVLGEIGHANSLLLRQRSVEDGITCPRASSVVVFGSGKFGGRLWLVDWIFGLFFFVLWSFLSIIGRDVGLFTIGGGFGDRRWWKMFILLSLQTNFVGLVFKNCLSYIFKRKYPMANHNERFAVNTIVTIFTSLSPHGPIFPFRPNIKHLTRAIKTHRNTAKLTTTTTTTTAIFKSAPRSATTASSSSTATASNTQSHHFHPSF
ncbi:hypothetical protein SLA2020_340240 [Shorea laevis]